MKHYLLARGRGHVEVGVGGEGEAVRGEVCGEVEGVLLHHVAAHVTRVVPHAHPGVSVPRRVLAVAQRVEEEVRLERGQSLEKKSKYIFLSKNIFSAKSPGT